nr:hypothetical protein CFP56_19510 [Quercus suber]
MADVLKRLRFNDWLSSLSRLSPMIAVFHTARIRGYCNKYSDYQFKSAAKLLTYVKKVAKVRHANLTILQLNQALGDTEKADMKLTTTARVQAYHYISLLLTLGSISAKNAIPLDVHQHLPFCALIKAIEANLYTMSRRCVWTLSKVGLKS